MASLYVTEFANLGTTTVGGRVVQAPAAPGLAEQKLAVGVGSVASAAFNAKTNFVMLHTDAICSLAFSVDGTDPTAAATAHRMGAGETRFYVVTPGGKVAVIQNT